MSYVDNHIHVGNHQSLHMFNFEHKILKNVKHWNKPSSSPYWRYSLLWSQCHWKERHNYDVNARYLITGTGLLYNLFVVSLVYVLCQFENDRSRPYICLYFQNESRKYTDNYGFELKCRKRYRETCTVWFEGKKTMLFLTSRLILSIDEH